MPHRQQVAEVINSHWQQITENSKIIHTSYKHQIYIVQGGGYTCKGGWKTARSDGKYLFHVKAMSQVFRGRFIAGLKETLPLEMPDELLSALYKKNWVI